MYITALRVKTQLIISTDEKRDLVCTEICTSLLTRVSPGAFLSFHHRWWWLWAFISLLLSACNRHSEGCTTVGSGGPTTMLSSACERKQQKQAGFVTPVACYQNQKIKKKKTRKCQIIILVDLECITSNEASKKMYLLPAPSLMEISCYSCQIDMLRWTQQPPTFTLKFKLKCSCK